MSIYLANFDMYESNSLEALGRWQSSRFVKQQSTIMIRNESMDQTSLLGYYYLKQNCYILAIFFPARNKFSAFVLKSRNAKKKLHTNNTYFSFLPRKKNPDSLSLGQHHKNNIYFVWFSQLVCLMYNVYLYEPVMFDLILYFQKTLSFSFY